MGWQPPIRINSVQSTMQGTNSSTAGSWIRAGGSKRARIAGDSGGGTWKTEEVAVY